MVENTYAQDLVELSAHAGAPCVTHDLCVHCLYKWVPVLRLHAARCSVRPRSTLSLPGSKAPSGTLYRLLLFHLRPRPTFSLPGARHSLPRSAVHYCFACLRALLCPFPVAMQSLPRPAAYYHLTASALNVAPSRRHCTLCRGQPVIESFQYIFGVDAV